MLRLLGVLTISMVAACTEGGDDDDDIGGDGDADGDADRPVCEPLPEDPQPTDDCDPACGADQACYGARCILAGGLGQACLPAGGCTDADLSCFEGRCQSAGIVEALYSAEFDEHYEGGSIFKDDVAFARATGAFFVPFEGRMEVYRAADRCAASFSLDPELRVGSIAVSADGSRLVVSGGRGQLERHTVLLDGIRGTLVSVLAEGCERCQDEIHTRFSANGEHVLGIHHREVFAWDAAGTLVWSDEREDAVLSVDLSPDGVTIGLGQLAGGSFPALHLRSIVDPAMDVALQHAYGGTFDAVAFHPDGERVLSLGFSTVTIWDIQTGAFRDIPADALATPHSPHLEGMALSPDGASLALLEMAVRVDGQEPLGGSGLHVSVWDVETGTQRARFYSHRDVHTLSWMDEPDVLLTYGHDRVHDLVCEGDGCADCEAPPVDCSRLPARRSVKIWDIAAMEAPQP